MGKKGYKIWDKIQKQGRRVHSSKRAVKGDKTVKDKHAVGWRMKAFK